MVLSHKPQPVFRPGYTTYHLHGDGSRSNGSSGLLVKQAEAFQQQLFHISRMNTHVHVINLWCGAKAIGLAFSPPQSFSPSPCLQRRVASFLTVYIMLFLEPNQILTPLCLQDAVSGVIYTAVAGSHHKVQSH